MKYIFVIISPCNKNCLTLFMPLLLRIFFFFFEYTMLFNLRHTACVCVRVCASVCVYKQGEYDAQRTAKWFIILFDMFGEI